MPGVHAHFLIQRVTLFPLNKVIDILLPITHLSIVDQNGETAIHWAVLLERKDYVNKILNFCVENNNNNNSSKYNRNKRNSNSVGDNNNHKNSNNNNINNNNNNNNNNNKRSKFDINAKNKHGQTAFLHAVRLGNIEIAKILLLNGADPYICDNMKMTSLHWSCLQIENGNCLKNIDMTKWLLDNKYYKDVDTKDMLGCTPLFYCIQNNISVSIIKKS